ncbi:MAG: hypothetical protein C0404_03370 [Verrucomicrobia bacterium]|nr:hypothetical protein [Verrucomicrobiota bacterium]
MYEEYWKLKIRPFKNTSDTGLFYHSSQHDEALMKLTYAINENLSGAMLTGDYGCGKTMISRMLLAGIGPGHKASLCVARPDMTSVDLLRAIARQVTGREYPVERSQLVVDALFESMERAFTENVRDGKHNVVLIDEAHMITDLPVLEMIRSLLNFQSDDQFMVTLLLFGHPELAERVSQVKQLAQRIPVTCRLTHFDREDTIGYVRSRLMMAGRPDGPFTDDALNLIFRNSGGIPRRVNTICDVSLALGFAQRVTRVDSGVVMEASETFGVI